MSEPATTERRYRTRGGITVHRSDRETAIGPAAAALVERLDRYPGVFMSSCFEFPGRYTRWDLGLRGPAARHHLPQARIRGERAGAARPGPDRADPRSDRAARRRRLPGGGGRSPAWADPPADGDRARGAAQPAALDLQPAARGDRPLRQRRGSAFWALRRLRLRPRAPVRAGGAAPGAPGRPARPGALRAGRDPGRRSHVGEGGAAPLRFRHAHRRHARHAPRAGGGRIRPLGPRQRQPARQRPPAGRVPGHRRAR